MKKNDLDNQKQRSNYLDVFDRLLLHVHDSFKKYVTVAQVSAEMVLHYHPSSSNSSSRAYARKCESLGNSHEDLGEELIEI